MTINKTNKKVLLIFKTVFLLALALFFNFNPVSVRKSFATETEIRHAAGFMLQIL